ncbi:hypothetical protein CEXT_53871 [Caerostris extrusa]|uniref:Uncharacterized protein n=1 Tax=Caerostris extrusa TaxID=172846 RepID=A0AAV4TT89_CAEEX|nr:hypothetical protein CEXT_53871 [Caerostris extrusa]
MHDLKSNTFKDHQIVYSTTPIGIKHEIEGCSILFYSTELQTKTRKIRTERGLVFAGSPSAPPPPRADPVGFLLQKRAHSSFITNVRIVILPLIGWRMHFHVVCSSSPEWISKRTSD